MTRELPKYLTVVNWSKNQITANDMRYGEKFYTEDEVSQLFGFCRQTVRQAMGVLVQEGYLERRRGSGTYVAWRCNVSVPTRSIGVVSTYMDSYIFPNIIKGIDLVLREHHYSMSLTLTHNKVENELLSLQLMLDRNVDGIIIEPTKSGLPNPNQSLYAEVKKRRIPLIFFNAYYPGSPFPHVCMDDHKAGKLAANALIRAGHKKIAGIFQSDDRQGHLRYAGYVEALAEVGLEVHSGDILWFVTEDIPYLAEDFKRIQRCIEDCTGVVCYNDQIAFILITELRRRGVEIPGQLSLVGIDNADLASICEVPFTTVAHPMEQLGAAAAENILALIKDPKLDVTIDFDPQLVERRSIRFV